MQDSTVASAVSGCSTISHRAVSTATEIDQLRSQSPLGDAGIDKLAFLATKLQQFRQHVDTLQQCLRDATVISDKLQVVVNGVVKQCDSASAVLQKQVMRVQPQNLSQLNEGVVETFQALLDSNSRVFILASQLLSVPSTESQDSKLNHSDSEELVAIAKASAQKIVNGVDLLSGSGPYAKEQADGPSTTPTPALLPSTEAETSQKSPKAGGLLSSLSSSFKAMAAGMRPKPEPFVSALCQAASRGNTQVMKGLLEQGANINGRNEDGNTALITAILSNQPETAIYLLQAGADKSARSSSGKRRPPLYHALEVNDMRSAQYLLDHGASVNERNMVGQSYFVDVVKSENIAQIQLLLRYGADVHTHEISSRTIIAWAVTRGNMEVVRILLAHGADPNARDLTGHPIICTAASKDKMDLVQLLLSSGADPNSRNATGTSLLVDAVQRGKVDLAKVLLTAGAKADVRDLMGTSILLGTIRHTSLSEADKETLTGLLLQHGADPNTTDSWGLTPLAHAAAANNLTLFQALLRKGADPNQYVHSDTLLVNALENKHWEQVEMLLRKGADPNRADKNGQTPLIVAIQKAPTEIVRLLLEKGADANKTGTVGPMMVARTRRDDQLVELLRRHGAADEGDTLTVPEAGRRRSRAGSTGRAGETLRTSAPRRTGATRTESPPNYRELAWGF